MIVRLGWIIVVGGAGLLIAWWQGNLSIAVITVSTCLVLIAVCDVMLRLRALEKHFGLGNRPEDEDN
jgi:hypothetical protein